MVTVRASLAPADRFVTRHVGPSPDETRGMLATLGYDSLDAFIDAVIPEDIRLRRPLALPPGRTEREVLQALRGLAAQNQLYRSYIGMGYHHSFTPQVIQRNIVENPGWYTAYTPYQPEIAQGRLEALLNFQTMVADLTALPITNASLLDEATAAAEAMHLTEAVARPPAGVTPVFMIADGCHPQTTAGVAHGPADTRAAHPPREGHEQHLHRAGAAGRDGEHVRGVPRARGPAPHRRAGPHAHGAARECRDAAGLPRRAFDLLRHIVHRGRVVGVAATDRRGPRPPHQPADHLADPHRRLARRGHHARRPRGPGGRVLTQRGPAVHGRGSRGQG